MLLKVKSILNKRIILLSQSLRFCSNTTGSSSRKILYPLNKGVLEVKGDEAADFLQGLITNDMRHLDVGSGVKSLYAMFLNQKGRVLFDTLIHHWESDTYLIECDKPITKALHRHLKLYKLRRRLIIDDVSDKLNFYALLSPVHQADKQLVILSEKVNIFKDPRMPELGFRVISDNLVKADDVSNQIGKNCTIDNDSSKYQQLRYSLGVSEGSEDIPPESGFPLEMNCDYLHGVSFHKGCYIGQEVTARVHHTGVVRKRIMPLKFTKEVADDLPKNTPISCNGVAIGKLKGVIKDCGLGLIRIKESLEAKELQIGPYSCHALKPTWWPLEAPKEKLTL